MQQENSVSVVVCVKNEAKRIHDCLSLICANNPDEIVVVDGDSSDETVTIAKKFPVKVVVSKNSNLTRDRQVGIDEARNDIVVMIDADHRLDPDSIDSLVADLYAFNLDIVQSQLCSTGGSNFWTDAEDSAWELTHNIPGEKAMIGTAPAVYRKRVFDCVRFEDNITSTIDDTDFIYRLSKFPDIKIGIGHTKIKQYHFSDFKTYLHKFRWYGKGDGEFCLKNPNRAFSMIYHLLIRYPVIYAIKSLSKGQFKAVPFFIMQGFVRFYGLVEFLCKHAMKAKK